MAREGAGLGRKLMYQRVLTESPVGPSPRRVSCPQASESLLAISPLLFGVLVLHSKPLHAVFLRHRFCGSGMGIGAQCGWFAPGTSAGLTQSLGNRLKKSSFTCLVLDAGCQLELGWAAGRKPPWPLHMNSLHRLLGLPFSVGGGF